MQTAIRTIVNEVPQGFVFDSHFIINELVKRFSDQYLSFASRFAADNQQVTMTTHGQIGQEINRLDGTVIQRIGNAWSENIHKTPSQCTCWRKL
jgi:hypothetical protein